MAGLVPAIFFAAASSPRLRAPWRTPSSTRYFGVP
jgi:hypothetical protein